jgi:hypothetical protein
MTILRLGASAWLAAVTHDSLRAMQEADSAERLEEASEGTPAPPVPPEVLTRGDGTRPELTIARRFLAGR